MQPGHPFLPVTPGLGRAAREKAENDLDEAQAAKQHESALRLRHHRREVEAKELEESATLL